MDPAQNLRTSEDNPLPHLDKIDSVSIEPPATIEASATMEPSATTPSDGGLKDASSQPPSFAPPPPPPTADTSATSHPAPASEPPPHPPRPPQRLAPSPDKQPALPQVPMDGCQMESMISVPNAIRSVPSITYNPGYNLRSAALMALRPHAYLNSIAGDNQEAPTRRRTRTASQKRKVASANQSRQPGIPTKKPIAASRRRQTVQTGPDLAEDYLDLAPRNPYPVHRDHEHETVQEGILRRCYNRNRNERLHKGRDALIQSEPEDEVPQKKRKTHAAGPYEIGAGKKPFSVDDDDDENNEEVEQTQMGSMHDRPATMRPARFMNTLPQSYSPGPANPPPSSSGPYGASHDSEQHEPWRTNTSRNRSNRSYKIDNLYGPMSPGPMIASNSPSFIPKHRMPPGQKRSSGPDLVMGNPASNNLPSQPSHSRPQLDAKPEPSETSNQRPQKSPKPFFEDSETPKRLNGSDTSSDW